MRTAETELEPGPGRRPGKPADGAAGDGGLGRARRSPRPWRGVSPRKPGSIFRSRCGFRSAWPRRQGGRGKGQGRVGRARSASRCARRRSAGSRSVGSGACCAESCHSDEQIRKLFADGLLRGRCPHDGMRKTIARRLGRAAMSERCRTTTSRSIARLDALLALRKQLNEASPKIKTEAGDKPAYKLSVNDMIVKAMALALTSVPDANVSWTESRHAETQACRRRSRGFARRRADHPDHPPRGRKDTIGVISNEMKDRSPGAPVRAS